MVVRLPKLTCLGYLRTDQCPVLGLHDRQVTESEDELLLGKEIREVVVQHILQTTQWVQSCSSMVHWDADAVAGRDRRAFLG